MKTVVITGASRGLGLAISRRMLHENYVVIGVARTLTDTLSVLMQESNTKDVRFHFISADLSETASLYDLAQKILVIDRKPYALINNAAIGLDGVLGTQHEKDIDLMIRVNVQAPILLTKYLSRAMMVSGVGRIVNISSIVATTGFSGLAVYGATKAAMVGFGKSLARELGKIGITVNTVCPGYMETDMTVGLKDDKLESIRRRSPFGKFADPSDVAGAVSYLLGPDAKMVTGTTITVDAGSTA